MHPNTLIEVSKNLYLIVQGSVHSRICSDVYGLMNTTFNQLEFLMTIFALFLLFQLSPINNYVIPSFL